MLFVFFASGILVGCPSGISCETRGCQYWALGDEQLMADHPKDTEYRKKVMRWGSLAARIVGSLAGGAI